MIKIQHLSKNYVRQGETCAALKNINLDIKPGEIFGVIGRSGAGKSTLVRCMNFIETPDAGEVIINGTNLAHLSRQALSKVRHKIGMVFQHFNLLSYRTVQQNIALALELQKMAPEFIQARVNELLALVGLTSKKDSFPDQLSGGQKQRVAIARALASKPDILLCDEATCALDPETTQSILALLKIINHQLGVTIVIITHEMDVIKKICTRVAVMEAGEIVEEGAVIDLFAHPQSAITKRLTQSSLKLALPDAYADKMQSAPFAGSSPIVRLIFIGQQADEPLLANLVKNFSVSANILQADLEFIQDALIGVSICQMIGKPDDVTSALDYLQVQQIKVEIMGYA